MAVWRMIQDYAIERLGATHQPAIPAEYRGWVERPIPEVTRHGIHIPLPITLPYGFRTLIDIQFATRAADGTSMWRIEVLFTPFPEVAVPAADNTEGN
ncbi:hypothetical protein C8Q79DRAFT_1006296 [Trametes meyenii]|nr:hypothetical protein C8Q79DRAFT_1006296 [Trametes meyenii]